MQRMQWLQSAGAVVTRQKVLIYKTKQKTQLRYEKMNKKVLTVVFVIHFFTGEGDLAHCCR